VIVLDGQARLRYRGAVDGRSAAGAKRDDAATAEYVRDALEAILADRAVAVAATPVNGPLLDRVEVKPAAGQGVVPRLRRAAPALVGALEEVEGKVPVDVGRVTYAGDVARILQERCQSCHRPGQVAPFPLLSYDDARSHAAMIAEVVDDRRMPPWHADPRYGHFKNDRHLTPRERETLLPWVEQGAPLGDPAALPPPRTFRAGWQIRPPHVRLAL